MRTVLGAVEASGHIQPHEHIFVRATPASRSNPALEISDPERSLVELLGYRAAGGAAIVDAQPLGAGRDAAALRSLSVQSGVAIVAVTGFHLPGFYAPESSLLGKDEEALFALYLRELSVGMEECPQARAGAVKAAIGRDGIQGAVRARLRAAARAAAKADVALIVHTEAGMHAVEAVDLCAECGLDPRRVLVCHADRQAWDYAPHEAIAATGAYLEYDTVGRFKYHSDEDEARLIVHMLSRGYGDRLLLSLDTTAQRLSSYGGEIGLDYLLRTFLPRLRACGVSEDDLARITRENPARALG